MFSGRPNEITIWSRMAWWLTEIAVVFIGVYLAFLLDSYRTEQNNEHKRQQIYTSLYNYFEHASANLQQVQSFKSDFAVPFLKAYENEQMPRLKPLPFFGSGFSDETWGAMLQTGGINLLDVNFILQVDGFFTNLRFINEKLKNVNGLYNQYLLPNINADISTFYNTESKEIRPLYSWYVQFLNNFPNGIKRMEKKSNNILAVLEEKMNKQQLKKAEMDSPQ